MVLCVRACLIPTVSEREFVLDFIFLLDFIVAYNNPGSGSLIVDPSVLLTFQNQKLYF